MRDQKHEKCHKTKLENLRNTYCQEFVDFQGAYDSLRNDLTLWILEIGFGLERETWSTKCSTIKKGHWLLNGQNVAKSIGMSALL